MDPAYHLASLTSIQSVEVDLNHIMHAGGVWLSMSDAVVGSRCMVDKNFIVWLCVCLLSCCSGSKRWGDGCVCLTTQNAAAVQQHVWFKQQHVVDKVATKFDMCVCNNNAAVVQLFLP